MESSKLNQPGTAVALAELPLEFLNEVLLMIPAPAQLLTAGLLGTFLLSGLGQAQEGSEELTPLARASRTFAAADLDRNGLIELDELKQASISSSVLKTWDEDASSSLSKDEFLGYYRRLMVNAGLPPGAELDTEVKRIEAEQAARKERAARQRAQEEQKAQKAQKAQGDQPPAPERPAQTETPAGGESTLDKYKRAQAALNARLAAARASREVASEQQQALAERARAAGSTQPSTIGSAETARERLARAQAALEGRARGSNATREQLARAQARLEDRATRKAGSASSTPVSVQQAAPDAPQSELRSKLERASDKLVDRAQSGEMTREQQQALQAALEGRARKAAQSGTAQPKPAESQESVGSSAAQSRIRAQELEGVPATDRDKISRALDAMEERARKGNWSREKLAAEKADLISRARSAQPAPTPEAVGETPEERRAREARKRAAEAQKPSAAGETSEQRKAREARKRAAEAQKSSAAGETPEQRKAREARKRAAEAQKPSAAGETPEQRKAREARKRAAEAQKPPAAGETPEQRKARETRKGAADASKAKPSDSGRSGAGPKAQPGSSGKQRPAPASDGRSRSGGR